MERSEMYGEALLKQGARYARNHDLTTESFGPHLLDIYPGS